MSTTAAGAFTATSVSRPRFGAAAVAGYTHAAAWVAALAVGWGVLPELGDSPAEVAAAYDGHRLAAVVQSALNHGLAAAAIAVVAFVLLARGRRLAGGLTALAAVLAFGQLALEQAAIAGTDTGRTGDLYDLSLRVDGVKMLALGGVAVVTARMLGAAWRRRLAYVTAAALALSGIAYLALSTTLAGTAFLSLPLLLVWFAVLGVRTARQGGGETSTGRR